MCSLVLSGVFGHFQWASRLPPALCEADRRPSTEAGDPNPSPFLPTCRRQTPTDHHHAAYITNRLPARRSYRPRAHPGSSFNTARRGANDVAPAGGARGWCGAHTGRVVVVLPAADASMLPPLIDATLLPPVTGTSHGRLHGWVEDILTQLRCFTEMLHLLPSLLDARYDPSCLLGRDSHTHMYFYHAIPPM